MFLEIINEQIDQVLETGFNLIITVAAIIFIIQIIMTGIKFMTSNSAEEHQQAKSKLIWVIVGFILCILSIVIFNVVWSKIQSSASFNPKIDLLNK